MDRLLADPVLANGPEDINQEPAIDLLRQARLPLPVSLDTRGDGI